jgi:TolA-binding protein
MNRRSTSSRLPIPRAALLALSLLLGAPVGAADSTVNPPANLAVGSGSGPAPAAAAILAVPPAKAPVKTDAHLREADGLLNLGARLTERGEYGTAEIAYWQILHNPERTVADEKSALLGLAHLYRKQGGVPGADAIYVTKADAIYEKFLKDYPDDERAPDALLELGRTQREMGAYNLAISRFYSVINSTLKFPTQGFEHYQALAKTAQFEIAQTYFESGDYVAAARYFSKVRLLDLAPADRAHAHFMTAFSQQLGGDYEHAVATLREFIAQWPEDQNIPQARYFLSTSLLQLNRTQEALVATLELLREEHRRDTGDPKRWSYWQRRTGNQIANEFFQTGDTFNALAIYKGLNELSPEPSWRLPVTYQIALCYERLHQLDDARAAYGLIITAGKGAPGGPPASPEIAQLAQMSDWRLRHLDWRDNVERQFNVFFTGSADPAAAKAAPAQSPAADPAPPPPPGTQPKPSAPAPNSS